MSKQAAAERWKDAVGVLPLDAVLAQEHDRIHGDNVSERIRLVPITFAVDQVTSPSAFAHRLLRAWRAMRDAGARASRELDAAPLMADEPPLDAVVIFVLSSIPEEGRGALFGALDRCRRVREEGTNRVRTPGGNRTTAHAAASTRVADADAALVKIVLPHLDALLDVPLEQEPVFASFLADGAVDALGADDARTLQRVRRLLIEAAFDGQIRRLRDVRLEIVYAATRRHDTAALCLSGGGIRSATFAVGVIRGLAHYGLLSRIDYLSTVSGGGFAGGWLSAWMHHTSAHEVQEALKRSNQQKIGPEPAPMQHLRAYSHFLAPRVGMFSTDTWTLITTVGRNLVLNLLVLVPLIAAALLLPRFVVALLRTDLPELEWPVSAYPRATLLLLLGAGLLFGTWAARYVHASRPHEDDAPRTGDTPAKAQHAHRAGTQRAFIGNCFVPLAAAALILTTTLYLWWTWSGQSADIASLFASTAGRTLPAAVFADPLDRVESVFGLLAQHRDFAATFLLFGVIMHTGGWLLSGRVLEEPWEVVTATLSGVAAGAVGLVVGLWFLSRPPSPDREILYATLAPAAFLGVMLVGSQLFTALTSTFAGDAEREWITRFNAWLLIAIIVWIALCGLVLYGPIVASEAWQQVSLAGLGGAAGIVAVTVARRMSEESGGSSTLMLRAARIGLAVGPTVFVLCVVVALASMNERLISGACQLPISATKLDCRPRRPRPDDLSHSQPFVVLSRHRARDIEALAEGFGSKGTDRVLLSVFSNSADASRELMKDRLAVGPGPWLDLVDATKRQATAAIARTLAADDELREHSGAFTAATLALDSATVRGIGGDSVLRELFGRRAHAVQYADSVLHGRLIERDLLASRIDSMRRVLDSAAAVMAAQAPDAEEAVRPLRNMIDERLRSSIGVFHTVRADSVTRAASHEWVEDAVSKAGQQVPYDGAVPLTIIALFAGLAALGLLLGRRIDTNKFSLRAMYEMRLVRAYLGASRPACDRQPNPFTGFDPRDDFPIGQLFPAVGATTSPGGRNPSSPPMHVVNTTLNLVAGGKLAWQQRKAESMTITPLHAGSAYVGYRPTTPATVPASSDQHDTPQLYGGRTGVTLGTAVTISGAAASPNAGSYSSSTITFLMTFFNARLGAWLGNPGRAGARTFTRSAPLQTVRPILDEMFGLTTDVSPYVYLSDGGHFENLALYEMVLRRCRFIIVSDAGADSSCTFTDLGNAVRKIRVDLGVPIEFPDGVHIYPRGQVPDGLQGSYWALGRIKYSAVDGAGDTAETDGLLLYLKPGIYEREPSDVQQYSRASATFPHESTADQFFTETQFESYRALGEYIVKELVTHPFTSSQIEVKGSRAGSLLSHWRDILQASDSSVHIPATEAGVWPTAVEAQPA